MARYSCTLAGLFIFGIGIVCSAFGLGGWVGWRFWGGFFCRFLPFYIHFVEIFEMCRGERGVEGGVVVFTEL